MSWRAKFWLWWWGMSIASDSTALDHREEKRSPCAWSRIL